jgi:hypothetical protein
MYIYDHTSPNYTANEKSFRQICTEIKTHILCSIIFFGHVARMGEGRGMHRVLAGKPEGRRPLGRHRHRWEYNIKLNLQEVGGGSGDWMERAQDRDRWWALVSTVMNFQGP